MSDLTCSIDGCTHPTHGRSYCRSHYMRWWRYGDPLHVHDRAARPTVPVGTRFWSKVDLSDPDGCWPWTGSRRHFYGEVQVEGRKEYAHRVAWALVHGVELTPALVVRHTCDNQLCVRPDHLVDGTQAQNVGDMSARGRWRNQHAAGPNHDPLAWSSQPKAAS